MGQIVQCGLCRYLRLVEIDCSTCHTSMLITSLNLLLCTIAHCLCILTPPTDAATASGTISKVILASSIVAIMWDWVSFGVEV